jgi:hypothetical protein
MKWFGIGTLATGVALFIIGVFDFFYLTSKQESALIRLGIPLIFIGIGITAFALNQESKKK